MLFFLDLSNFFVFNFLLVDFDWFHGFNCLILLLIIFFVFFLFFFLFISSFYFKLFLFYQVLEVFGCFLPVFILFFQMLFSLNLLFGLSFLNLLNDLTIKIIGHQWYWSYEFGDFLGLEFDSYLKLEDFFFLGDFRLLEVDNRLILPLNINIRLILTSSDVIHSWTLPSFFLKLDVMSGLMSIINFSFDTVGVFFGQCSEICGVNHSFMPIVVEVTLFDFYKSWMMSNMKF